MQKQNKKTQLTHTLTKKTDDSERWHEGKEKATPKSDDTVGNS